MNKPTMHQLCILRCIHGPFKLIERAMIGSIKMNDCLGLRLVRRKRALGVLGVEVNLYTGVGVFESAELLESVGVLELVRAVL